ncbi:ExbD/TolR family protein [Ilyobacter polytropus]|uniref:Outer membrane transport energization protein ExbD n=1 Tax=Ilyobacter polytropus (strain ATCC 51220 / DSM 2926 / LMG 16218 / CuHBu1) TaxID=572544 RepID=E3H9E0_ILYPC|nr:biopolymer transporter ExbD [Ilyobacter polytropus]ADO83049.1 outer membrane transport energization protein ExbD [Ilyobacter polytropus DSM 2926]
MRLKRMTRRNSGNMILELTPLIDVVFLLLIFFMVATTFEDLSGIKIDLPQSTIKEVREVKEIQILIDENSELYLNYRETTKSKKSMKVTLENLKEELGEKLLNSSEKNVIITADKKLDYGFIVEIMTIAKEAGASSLDIDTAVAK